jgi:hypothetical protein
MKKEKKGKKAVYNEEIYIKIPINHLIIFSMYSVLETNKKCSFERLIQECFNLFPKTFSFSQHPQWPDSRKLDRPLRLLRNKKLIIGDPKTSFFLTKIGRNLAEEISKNFRQKKTI